MHVVAAVVSEYSPPPQLVHADMALAAAYMPAVQSTQVVAFVAAVAFDALPAAQLVHTDTPLLTAY